ncbi:efflux RND transporter periplasmic adaptor subunit [Plebeiibacterium sediminum]|uniref:Efflux RND transporter periplasmic adaptor subunit n=1 Tax=Plebeiibacterium sediminum TaxID=2992112 RepID=A0AAE3M1C5_9BACT|nr:efflux RND transporter periplasmic adaptor subunit [Plebeiobacterium sediminum]MCW3784985.1 efflux RND transporter periplasmic adaptor subunit [Plebeiobacterium sediminum]
MKKIITYIILFTILAACSSSEKEEIKAKIAENRKTIKALKKENTKLEKELKMLSEDSVKFKLPVVTKEVTARVFKHFILASGLLEAVQSANISPEVPAQIKLIHVVEGQYVQKGQLLVSLNSTIISNAIKEIETNLELAKDVYDKQKSLWDQNIGSEIEYLQAKTNKESLERTLETQKAQFDLYQIKAPFDGIVDNIISKEGELSSPGAVILQFVNLSKMKINSEVSEAFLPFIHSGDTIELTFSTYPDLIIKEPIVRTGNIIHPENRTFNVQVVLKNQENKLKPNMMASMKINDYKLENALVVPSAIIKNDITGQFLFVVENNTAKKIYVESGRSYKDETVVVKGLKEGDQVIVEGFNTVSNGTLVELR